MERMVEYPPDEIRDGAVRRAVKVDYVVTGELSGVSGVVQTITVIGMYEIRDTIIEEIYEQRMRGRLQRGMRAPLLAPNSRS